MLRIEIQSSNHTATLYCSGNVVLGVETETLRAMVQARHEDDLRVNLSAVEKIDASGLGLLVELTIWAREDGKTLTLLDLPESVWRLIILTKLYSALEISYAGVHEFSRQSSEFGPNQLIA